MRDKKTGTTNKPLDAAVFEDDIDLSKNRYKFANAFIQLRSL